MWRKMLFIMLLCAANEVAAAAVLNRLDSQSWEIGLALNAAAVRVDGISLANFKNARDQIAELLTKQISSSLSRCCSNTTVSLLFAAALQKNEAVLQPLTIAYVVEDQDAGLLKPWQLDYWLETQRGATYSELGGLDSAIVSPSDICELCKAPNCAQDAELVKFNASIELDDTSVRHYLNMRCSRKTQVAQTSCSVYTCNNRGKCKQNHVSKSVYCECESPYEGPRCELLSRNFDGLEFLMPSPLFWRRQFHLSFEFDFRHGVRDGVLLSIGRNWHDSGLHLLLVVRSARLVLQVRESGEGAVVRESSFAAPLRLAYDLPHRLDLLANDSHLLLLADRCAGTTRKLACTASVRLHSRLTTMKGEPVLIGGLPAFLHNGTKNFSGCIRNFRFNRNFVDLSADVSWNASREIICRSAECDNCSPVTAVCDAYRQCRCKPGYFSAPQCNDGSVAYDFANGSNAVWKINGLSRNIIRSDTVHLQVQFRTYVTQGHVLTLNGSGIDVLSSHAIVIQIDESRLKVKYALTLSNLSHAFTFYNTNVSDGQWHTLVFSRVERSVEMLLDSGDASNYFFSFGEREENFVKSHWDGHLALAFASDYLQQPFVGNFRDLRIRFDHRSDDFLVLRTLEKAENSALINYLPDEVDAHVVSVRSVVKETDNATDFCASRLERSLCPASFVCVNVWRSHLCLCPNESMEVRTRTNERGEAVQVCMERNACLSRADYCENGGQCQLVFNNEPQYRCVCTEGLTGERCTEILIVATSRSFLPRLLFDFVKSSNFLVACSLALLVAFACALTMVCMKKSQLARRPKHSRKHKAVQEVVYDDLQQLPRQSVGLSDGIASDCLSDAASYACVSDRDCQQFDLELLRSQVERMRCDKLRDFNYCASTPDYAPIATHAPVFTPTFNDHQRSTTYNS